MYIMRCAACQHVHAHVKAHARVPPLRVPAKPFSCVPLRMGQTPSAHCLRTRAYVRIP